VLCEGLEDVSRDGFFTFPVHREREKMFFEERPACFLPFEVGWRVVGGWEPTEVGWFGEGEWALRRHDGGAKAAQRTSAVRTIDLFSSRTSSTAICRLFNAGMRKKVGEWIDRVRVWLLDVQVIEHSVKVDGY